MLAPLCKVWVLCDNGPQGLAAGSSAARVALEAVQGLAVAGNGLGALGNIIIDVLLALTFLHGSLYRRLVIKGIWSTRLQCS